MQVGVVVSAGHLASLPCARRVGGRSARHDRCVSIKIVSVDKHLV
jgi:hypothetical protein